MAFQHRKKRVAGRLVATIVVLVSVSGCATLSKSSNEDEPQAASVEANQRMAQGDAAVRRGDPERAILEYVGALNVDGRNEAALLRLAAVHADRGDVAAAERSFRRLIEIDDHHAGAWEGLGLLRLRAARYNEAEESARRATELDATRWRAHNALGVIADLQGHPENAAAHYQAALALQPDSPILLNNLGYSRYLAADWPAAESYFEAALSKDPANAHAWSNLGLTAARRKNYEKALDAFRRVGDDAQAHNNLGYLCILEGRYADAERFLREAIRLSPTYHTTAEANLALLRSKRSAR